MPTSLPRRRFTLVDLMILVASTAALFAVLHTCAIAVRAVIELKPSTFDPIQAAIVGPPSSWASAASAPARPDGGDDRDSRASAWGIILGPLGVLMIALMPHRPDDRPTATGAGLTAPGG